MIEKGVQNVDERVVAGFGDEWTRFDQTVVPEEELEGSFHEYFRVFPWEELPPNAVGFDLGCGTGRYARLVAPRVGRLHCIDASTGALDVARKNLAGQSNCEFHLAAVGQIPIPDASADFGYSIGVLHHIPDPAEGIRACTRKLKKGAPLLLYIYYRFDNRPRWYAALWRLSEILRRAISRLPRSLKFRGSDLLAATIYWPLARFALLVERLGLRMNNLPLRYYRHRSFYTMRTDALDRFGTRLEQRFSRDEISAMMRCAGLKDITFSDSAPFWCAVGVRES
jgi:SAM-dependent methyltransferase